MQAGAQSRADLPCQADPQDQSVGGRVEVLKPALAHVAGEVRDEAFGIGIGADKVDAGIRAAVADHDLPAQARGDGGAGQLAQAHKGGVGIFDAAQFLFGLQAAQGHRPVRETALDRLELGIAVLVCDADVGCGVDDLAFEIDLAPLQHGRRGDGEPDAQSDADEGNQRLPGPAAQVGQGDVEDDPHGTGGLTAIRYGCAGRLRASPPVPE